MGNSKVIFGNETLIDLTGDTVTPDTLLAGTTAHNRSGNQIVGTATVPEELDDLTDVTLTSPAEGDLLQYNDASGEWVNSADVPNTMAITGAHQLFKIYDLDVQKTRNLSGTWSGNVYTWNGGVWTFNADKSITASGTPTEGSSFTIAGELPATVVRLKNPSAATNTRYGVLVLRNASGSAVTSFNYANVPHDAEIIEDLSSYSFSFVTLEIKRSQNNVAMNNSGIPLATIPSDKSNVYTQYAETNTVLTQKVAGLQKTGCVNLLNCTADSQVVYGITITKNSDKSYTLNGTFTSSNREFVALYPSGSDIVGAGTWRVVGCPSGFSSKGYLDLKVDGTWGMKTENGTGITFKASTNVNGVVLYILPGSTFNGEVIKPMITTDLSATYDDYQPYAMTNRELTEVADKAITVDKNWAFTGAYSTLTDNTTFTCPEDGYLFVQMPKQSTGEVRLVYDGGNALFSETVLPSPDIFFKRVVFLRKGLKIKYVADGATPSYVRFYTIV